MEEQGYSAIEYLDFWADRRYQVPLFFFIFFYVFEYLDFWIDRRYQVPLFFYFFLCFWIPWLLGRSPSPGTAIYCHHHTQCHIIIHSVSQCVTSSYTAIAVTRYRYSLFLHEQIKGIIITRMCSLTRMCLTQISVANKRLDHIWDQVSFSSLWFAHISNT
jgi:hypothetical protein